MLGFNVNVLGGETAVLDHFREPLNNDSLRRYRVGGYDLGTREAYALGESLVA